MIAVKAALTKCYDADLVELNSVEDVEKAKKLNLVSTLASQDRIGVGALKEKLYNGQRRKPLIIASPHIQEAAELVLTIGKRRQTLKRPNESLRPA